jgi:L-cystine transport system permease protein
MPSIMKALPLTLIIMIVSLFFGLLLGLVLAVMKLQKNIILKSIANGYTAFIRGTPPLLQLFLVFYGLPQVVSSVGIDINDWSKSIFAVITFSLNGGAFISEIMRAAYLSIDVGQREAALSIGMNNIQCLRRIIIPQAFKISLPNLGNIIISLLKETSYVFTIGVVDILGKAKLIGSDGYGVRQLEVFIAVALIYWVICIIIEQLISLYEHMNNKSIKKLANSNC